MVFHTVSGRPAGGIVDQRSENGGAFGMICNSLQIAVDAGQVKKRCKWSSTGALYLGHSWEEMMFLRRRLALVFSLFRWRSHPKTLTFRGALESQMCACVGMHPWWRRACHPSRFCGLVHPSGAIPAKD
jgi:hypothetical protein